MGGPTDVTAPADGPADWVNRLSAVVLTAMLIYVIVGIPEFDRDALETLQAASTDAVNPLNRFVWLGLLAMAAPVMVARRAAISALLRANWPLVLLMLYFAASALWALDPPVSARRVMFSVVQLVLAATLISGLRRAVTLHILIVAACAAAAAADLAVWIAMPGYAMTPEGLAGLQTQKNQTGLLMMYGCLASGTALFLVRGRPARWFMMGALMMMLVLLVATRSTTSQAITLLTPVVVLCVLLAVRLSAPVIWALGAGLLALLAGLAAAYLAWCALTDADPWVPLRGATFTGRTDLWSFVLAEIEKRPWFGAGFSSLWAINPAVQPSLQTGTWFGTYTIINEGHQGYLDLLATGGVVGFTGGMFVVLRALGTALRAVSRAEPAHDAWRSGRLAFPSAVFHLSLVLSLLVHNLTESNLFTNNSLLAVALILAVLDLGRWSSALPHVAPATAAPAAETFPPVAPGGGVERAAPSA